MCCASSCEFLDICLATFGWAQATDHLTPLFLSAVTELLLHFHYLYPTVLKICCLIFLNSFFTCSLVTHFFQSVSAVGCIECMWCGLLQPTMPASVSLSVSQSDCQMGGLCKSGWTDWRLVWGKDFWWPKKHYMRWERGVSCSLCQITLASCLWLHVNMCISLLCCNVRCTVLFYCCRCTGAVSDR